MKHKTVKTDEQLAVVLTEYWESYAYKLPGASVIKAAIADALRVWDDPDISELDAQAQLRFVTTLRARVPKLVDWTILTKLNIVWGGMRWYQVHHLPFMAIPAKLRRLDWKPHLPDRTRVYTNEELAKLLDTAGELGADGERRAREEWWRYLTLAIGTASRITALLELRWDQVDLESGILALNPENREQTKKYRATIKIAPTLLAELGSWNRGDELVINHLGAPCERRGFFSELAAAAAIRGGSGAIRHTIRTQLARAGVDPGQADFFMGHAKKGSRTGAKYEHLQPDYLCEVVEALEGIYGALRGLIRHPLGVGAAREKSPKLGKIGRM